MKNAAVLEIGNNYIKIAATRFSIRKPLQGFTYLTKPISSLDDVKISGLLSETFTSLKLKPQFLALSLPRNLATVRILSLPSNTPEEISKMIDLHVVRVVPYKKEEVISCYSILDTDEQGFTKILLCIAHKDILKRYFKILTDGGLFLDKIYLSSYGVWEWILSNCKQEMDADTVYFGLDVDFDYLDLIAFSKEYLLFTRSIAIGSGQLIEQFGVDKLIKEIKQTIVIFRSEYENKKPEKVFISGAIERLKDLGEKFGKELEMPTVFLPLPQLTDKVKANQLDVSSTVSITSLKEFLFDNPKRVSLYLPELQVKKTLREETRDLIMVGSIFIYTFFIICGLFLGRVYNRQWCLEELQSHLKAIHQDIGDLIDQSKRIEVVKDVLKVRGAPLLFFQEIYPIIHSKVAVKDITLEDNNKVLLRGEAQSLSDVFVFVSVLEESKRFKNVETQNTRKRKTSKGERTSFELSLILEY
ncbi:MAG: PilN domain-containing protein [Candidatus Omnitrophica bacterium]|nr:PilN domain-containing protein [Candidatus Omnitrophota bacterium]